MADRPLQTLFSGVVSAGVTVIENTMSLAAVTVMAAPISGTVLVEATAASKTDVDALIASGSNANVLRSAWVPGTASALGVDRITAPWTALIVTVSAGGSARLNVTGQ